ncbi:MAG TPA: hypothetical protein VIL74_08845 [Pyrinomonadaceae bacterium]|jgi:hypothetical protein
MNSALPNDITGARHKNAVHSVAANERVSASKAIMRAAILEWARSFGRFTLKDVCRQFDKLPNQVSGRLSEMKAEGLIRETGESRERCAVLTINEGERKVSDFCKKCGAPIMWLKHKTSGKPAPIEAISSEQGNILVDASTGTMYRVATNDEIEKARRINHPLYLNHFVTCEFADSFKKEK